MFTTMLGRRKIGGGGGGDEGRGEREVGRGVGGREEEERRKRGGGEEKRCDHFLKIPCYPCPRRCTYLATVPRRGKCSCVQTLAASE